MSASSSSSSSSSSSASSSSSSAMVAFPSGAEEAREAAGMVLDSLPYIDNQLGLPEGRVEYLLDVADDLIDSELSNSTKTPQQLLEELYPLPGAEDPPSFGGSAALRAEWDRIAAGLPAEEIDLSGYQPRAPEDPQSAEEWRASLDRLRMNLEHQRARLLNLELMGRYGRASWERAVESAESQRRWVARAQREVQEEADNVNRKRKQDQLTALEELSRNRLEWYALAAKNNELEVACSRMESEVKRLRAAAGVEEGSSSQQSQSQRA